MPCDPQIIRVPAVLGSISRCNSLESIFVMQAAQNRASYHSVIIRNSVT
jgi:hypothetical protein